MPLSSWRARDAELEDNQMRLKPRGNDCSDGLKSNAVERALHQSRRDRRSNSVTTAPPVRSRSTSSISDERRSRTKDGQDRGVVSHRSGSVPAVPQIPRRWMIHGALMQERQKEQHQDTTTASNSNRCGRARVKKEEQEEQEEQKLQDARDESHETVRVSQHAAIIVAAAASSAGGRRRKSDSSGRGRGRDRDRHNRYTHGGLGVGVGLGLGSDDDREAWSTNTQPQSQSRRASASFPLRTPTSPRRTCRSEPRSTPRKKPQPLRENESICDPYSSESSHMTSLTTSRAPYASKRRSMPADPNTSFTSSSSAAGARPQSRLESLRASAFAGDDSTPVSLEQPRAALTRASLYDDTASVATFSQHGRSQRTSTLYDRASQSLRDRVHPSENIRPRRRGTSLGTEPLRRAYDTNTNTNTNKNSPAHTLVARDEAQTESSNMQQSDSSDDFDDANTVAEVHELKYRITRMESHGRTPPTSSTAASGESSDRPRTATTAPTTVDLSPKQLRKQDMNSASKNTPTPPVLEIEANSSSPAPAHPLLHDALARLKDNTQSNVYRAMEAVINDALQLAISANPSALQSTTYAAASSNDRHVKRKADNICRNLTDLCLALCDVQHERTPGVIQSSPAQMIASSPISPMSRFSRNNSLPVASPQQSRPMSRLEQRKASLLGEQSFTAFQNISPRASFGTISSEAESTPTHSNSVHQSSRRASETTTAHNLQRPPSRAATDVGSLRSKSRIVSESKDRRVPSLRESLTSRRNSAWNTPPSIREEESHPHRQQIFSSGRPISTAPGRTPSISKRRHLLE